MPCLSPPTLTRAEQAALLASTASHPRDHLILSPDLHPPPLPSEGAQEERIQQCAAERSIDRQAPGMVRDPFAE